MCGDHITFNGGDSRELYLNNKFQPHMKKLFDKAYEENNNRKKIKLIKLTIFANEMSFAKRNAHSACNVKKIEY